MKKQIEMVSILTERKRVTILKGELVMTMSSDERKIGIACFIGCAIGTAIAFAVAPWLWFLGLLTGCAVGYVACEFREVMAAIPIAVRAAVRKCGIARSTCWEVAKWFIQPHPFLHQAMVFALLMSLLVVWKSSSILPFHSPVEKFLTLPLSSFVYPFILAILVLRPLALLGVQRCEQRYWNTNFQGESLSEFEERELLAKGYTKKPLTYWNVLRWEAKGIGFIIWHLFKLINSDKRSVSGMGSALGVALAHYYFVPAPFSLGEHMMAMFFGACVGAVLGVLSWKLISVKCLGMPEHNPV